MDAWAKHFVEVWQANRVAIAEGILKAIKGNPYIPVKDYSIEDMLQIFDGVLAMMVEKLEGKGNDIWDTYMYSVVPGMLAQGQTLSALVGQVTINVVVLHQIIVPNTREEYRDQISHFLINYYANMNGEMVKVALENGAKA